MSSVGEYSECDHCWPFKSARGRDAESTACPTCGRSVIVSASDRTGRAAEPKSAEEIEAMRDRIGAIGDSGELEKGSQWWVEIGADEVARDWTVGEIEEYLRRINSAETEDER